MSVFDIPIGKLLEGGNVIGEGGFGTVHECNLGNNKVAAKCGKRAGLEEEVRILRMAQGNQFIVSLQGTVVEGNTMCLVMELCNFDLEKIMKYQLIDGEGAQWILRNITCALVHLESLGITHGDVKPSNILISTPADPASPTVGRLADFGSASLDSNIPTTVSQGYRAPESIIGCQKSARPFEIDVWCIGVLSLHLSLKRQNPFDSGALSSLCSMCEYATGDFPHPVEGVDVQYTETFYQLSRKTKKTLPNNFCKNALVLRPQDRPSPEELLCDPLVSEAEPVRISIDALSPERTGGRLVLGDITPPPAQQTVSPYRYDRRS
eukprot:TRINITY_DN7178_c0_g1_i1.p1 TRINITY_DN7178_c0_g1~~TRINITY_DN7178_c0_g1_i1.p1  ORF type:complete len:334 (+),score=48.92 TRINITY_DN7178_c0_g1_i1:39-1004(+)